jgi:hypothetical protein
MTPETLQTLGVLAMATGFFLVGLGGFSTYHASQKLQRAAEQREMEQRWAMAAQNLKHESELKDKDHDWEIQALLLKNQQLKEEAERQPQTYRVPSRTAPPLFPQQGGAPPQGYIPPAAPPAAGSEEQDNPVREPAQEAAQEPARTPEPDMLDPMESRHTNGTDWEEPESMRPEVAGKYLSIHQQHVIADTLRAHGRHVVTIESSYGDAVSHDFAEELSAAISDADWTVRGVDEHRGLPLAGGVTVSAGSFPPEPETRAVYEALLSAGIAVSQQLDPKQTKQRKSETVILVGVPL